MLVGVNEGSYEDYDVISQTGGQSLGHHMATRSGDDVYDLYSQRVWVNFRNRWPKFIPN